MARVPPSSRTMFISACLSAWEATTLGVTAKTNADRQKYWRHWATFAALTQTDPFLDPDKVGCIERDILVGAYAALVRRGTYGRGRQIKVSSVTDALSAISKTIELAGKPSPLYRKDNAYHLAIERLVEGYRRMDPPSVPQLAVPVSLAKTAFATAMTTKDPAVKHTGLLIAVAFYYLLRVGEYTKPRTVLKDGKRVSATRTKQFIVSSVGFFRKDRSSRVIPLSTFFSRPI